MPVSAITAIAAVAFVALVISIILSASAARRRRLRKRFGPEYDRAVAETGSRRQADAELAARLRRARDLDIRPLSDAARAIYLRLWPQVQERFVDQPVAAVGQASQLIDRVLRDQGYATDDPDKLLADLSVDHAQGVQHYRSARRLSQPSAGGAASTEALRQAMIRYRAVLGELIGEAVDHDEPGGWSESRDPGDRDPRDRDGGDGDVGDGDPGDPEPGDRDVEDQGLAGSRSGAGTAGRDLPDATADGRADSSVRADDDRTAAREASA